MKKAAALVWILISLLSGCTFDPYSDMRPFDYGDAKWVCEPHNIWFSVDCTQDDYYNPEGEIQINDIIYPCKLYFIHQTNQVCIVILESTVSDDQNTSQGELWGECRFAENTLTVHIDSKRDTLFDGEVESILFCRQETTD